MRQDIPLRGVSGRFVGRLFDKQLRPRSSICLALVLVGVAWALLLLWASAADGTLRLSGTGRGLIQHYGFQACLAAGPLVLLTTYLALGYFLRIVRDIGQFLAPSVESEIVADLVESHVRSLLLQGRWKYMLLLFVIVGVAVTTADATKLSDPKAFWGNDVFDATYYRRGFATANMYLLWLWGFVYPIGFFYAAHITLSSEMIVARLIKHRMLKLDFLHTDKCAGMSKFGTLNLIVMSIYLGPLLALYALYFTHRYTYPTLVGGAIAISIGFTLQSIYGIYWVSRAIRTEQEAAVVSLNENIRKLMEGARKNFTAAAANLQYRDRVLAVTPFPYSVKVSVAVNVLRFAPVVLAIVKLIGQRA